jgi:hypothetical protein
VTTVTAEIFAISPIVSVLWLASLIFAIFVIVDMANRPGWQWRAAGSNKVLWMVLEIVLLIGLLSVIVGIIYLAVVRPRLQAVARQGGGGPWGAGPGQAPPWAGRPYPGAGPGWGGGAPPGYSGGGQPQPGSGQPPYPGQPPGPPGPPPAGPPGPWAYPGGAPAGQASPYGQPPAPPPPVENPPFGWYGDPSGRHEKRYWDGTRWTEHVSDADVRSTDPVSG